MLKIAYRSAVWRCDKPELADSAKQLVGLKTLLKLLSPCYFAGNLFKSYFNKQTVNVAQWQ